MPHAAHSVLLCGDFSHSRQKHVVRCVEIRRLHGAVVTSVGCSSMDPGHHCCCCDVDGAAPGDHRGVGGCRNTGCFLAGISAVLSWTR